MSRVEIDPNGRRSVTLWKREGVDIDAYPRADDKPADSHKNSIERTNDMQSVQLQKKVEEHERRFGPLGGAAPSAVADGLPQALTKADELQEAHPNMSSAEAFRRIMRDPAVAAQYEKERGRAQGAAPAVVGLSKCEAVAEAIQKRDGVSRAEAFRQAMRTPAIRDSYDRETGHAEGAGTLAKSEEAHALDEAAVEKRAEQLEREGLPWREAWSRAIAESGHGGGARAAA